MSKLTIYVPAMKLKLIRDYCQEKKVPMSTIFTRGAMGIVNQAPRIKCEFCFKPSIGKFQVNYYQEDLGDVSKEVNLCNYHLEEAKRKYETQEL